jgi:hypothetical protein
VLVMQLSCILFSRVLFKGTSSPPFWKRARSSTFVSS